jgi:hypothetical protein
MRDVAARAADDGAIHEAEGARLMERARSLPFASRNWAALRKESAASDDAAAMARLEHWRASHPAPERAKLRDARAALLLVADDALPEAVAPDWASASWRTSFLRHWIARFQGQQGGGRHIPFLAVFQHQQLYDPIFAARWRRHVLSWIAGTADSAGLESRAVAIAEAEGLTLRNLTPEQVLLWLTDSEIATLDETEKTIRLLVRAIPQDATIPLTPIAPDQAADLIDPNLQSWEAVQRAFQYNDEVIRRDACVNVHDLRPDAIIHHLGQLWKLDPRARPAMVAAARDRGFTGIDHAVQAARSFFLWSTVITGTRD